MAYTESKKRAALKYAAKTLKRVKIDLNRNTEADLITWLDAQENKAGYIKDLIRADMARKGTK